MEMETPYTYLPIYADEIRLFHLDKVEEGDSGEIRGSLIAFRLISDETDGTTSQETSLRTTGIPIASENYDALSYCWGNGEKSSRIKIYDFENDIYQGSIDITPVLEEALVQFRSILGSEPRKRYFWIDIVCIDQSDDEEKGRQIQKMAAIYDQALYVRVWLGPESDSTVIAVSFINSLVNLGDIDKLTKDLGSLKQWTAFMELMQLPWFNRRWIIQELTLAREPIIYCGSHTVSWEHFTYAVDVFIAKSVKLRKLLKRSPLTGHDSDYLGELDALGAKTLVECTTNLFRKDERGSVIEHLYSLERLLASLTMFETSKPLDTFYAIMWLAYDATPRAKQPAQRRPQNALTPSSNPQPSSTYAEEGLHTEPLEDTSGPASSLLQLPPHVPHVAPLPSPTSTRGLGHQLPPPPSRRGTIDRSLDRTQPSHAQQKAEKHIESFPRRVFKVDYKKSVFEVCRDFLEFAIRSSRSLDIICTPWAPKPEEGKDSDISMPSWIPSVADRVYQRTKDSDIYVRVRADPLVGNLGPQGRPYRASGKQRAYNTHDQEAKFINEKELTTIGFILDEVDQVGDTSAFGIIPKSWLDLDLVTWSGGSDHLPAAFWRTLVADKGPDGYSPPPAYFPLACKWAFKSRVEEQGLSTNMLLNPKTPHKCPELAFKFVRRVQAVIWHRWMICTAGATKMGAEEAKIPPLLVLAPAGTQKGDLVCILYGASVPVVLRKRDTVSRSGATNKRKKQPPRQGNEDALPLPKRRQTGLCDSTDAQTLASTGRHLAELPGSYPPVAEVESSPVNTPAVNFSATSPQGSSHPAPVDSGPGHIPITDITELPEDVALKGGRYEFIGQCYVHGYMNGEAFTHQEQTGHPLREFILV